MPALDFLEYGCVFVPASRVRACFRASNHYVFVPANPDLLSTRQNVYPPVFQDREICEAFVVRDNFGDCSIAPLCHSNAECVLYRHTEYCNCKAGFSMTGEGGTNPSVLAWGTWKIHNPLLSNINLTQEAQICQDVDECSSSVVNPCPGNGVKTPRCVNNLGSFECICNQGFAEVLDDSGYFAGCEDEDECADTNTPVCVPSGGSCLNTMGSYLCSCNVGFNGSGYASRDGCRDLDECTMRTHECGETQFCLNTFGSFLCECLKPGFESEVDMM